MVSRTRKQKWRRKYEKKEEAEKWTEFKVSETKSANNNKVVPLISVTYKIHCKKNEWTGRNIKEWERERAAKEVLRNNCWSAEHTQLSEREKRKNQQESK